MVRATPWEAGRFDARAGPKRILFGRMYEDVALEDAAFAPGGRIFCIASAGCTAIALARHHQVTAVDINPVQLGYSEQRARGGPIRIGAAERLLGFGRHLMAPFGWRRQTLAAFLDLEDPEQQMLFWNRNLNSAVFRWAVDTLLSVTWLRVVYAAPFLEVLPPHFGRVLRGRLERCWHTHPNRSNPYAHALLLGGPSSAPVTRTHTIQFCRADAASFLESCAPQSFDGFTLSNILDGASRAYRERLLAAVRRAATPESMVVLRSFAEPRQPSVTNQARNDRAILWGIVDVRRAHELSEPLGF